jgi:hypothetical protein
MKKQFIILAAVASLTLAMPMSGFAQSKPAPSTATSKQAKDIKTVPGFEDVNSQELIHTGGGYLSSNGEDEYTAEYTTSMGDTIRYYLGDSNQNGMTIKIYYADADYNITSLYTSGTTSSSNNWTVLKEIPAPTKDTNFVIKIISSDGDGGWYYTYDSAIRAF